MVLSAEDHHDHLICISCGAITGVKYKWKTAGKISSEFGFYTVIHKMELYATAGNANKDSRRRGARVKIFIDMHEHHKN
jgi:Fe2+ or Zn2+ uptake regulation protein